MVIAIAVRFSFYGLVYDPDFLRRHRGIHDRLECLHSQLERLFEDEDGNEYGKNRVEDVYSENPNYQKADCDSTRRNDIRLVMERIINNMIIYFNVSEDRLKTEKEIETPI